MASACPAAVVVRDLHKSFGDHTVLDGVDLTVPRGTVFALLGPNGSGKTTTVRILTTLIPADSGDIDIDGHNLATDGAGVRRGIAVTGQFSAVDSLMTGRENLRLMADLRHLPRAERDARVPALLEQFGLTDAANRPASTYSGGMKRRLDIAMTLLTPPRVLFLDEPTAGLDPRSRRDLWLIIEDLVADGVTIFLTTQYLEEADRLAHRIAVLDGGRIVAEGSPSDLKRQIPGGHVSLRCADAEDTEALVRVLPQAYADPDQLSVTVPHDGRTSELRNLLDIVDGSGIPVREVSLHSPDLDDVFLALTHHDQAGTERTSA